MRIWKDPSGNYHYDYENDLDSLTKSKTMDPSEDIATPDSNLPSNFFDSVHTGPYYADDGEDESKYIAHSKDFKGYRDANNNLVGENSSNVLSGSTERVMGRPYTNSSVGSNYTSSNDTTNSPNNFSNVVSNLNSNNSPVSTEERFTLGVNVIQYLKNIFKKNNEPFDTRRVVDVSNNNPYDISANYELYNERGQLKIGYHDTTDYGSWFDALENEYKNLESKYKNSVKPIKCVADFGTNIGEDLCCGQEGVLQDTRFICPDTMPTCSNFKCGSRFGTCM
jgi:hypothetical protein